MITNVTELVLCDMLPTRKKADLITYFKTRYLGLPFNACRACDIRLFSNFLKGFGKLA